jgi:hypothetical protein
VRVAYHSWHGWCAAVVLYVELACFHWLSCAYAVSSSPQHAPSHGLVVVF